MITRRSLFGLPFFGLYPIKQQSTVLSDYLVRRKKDGWRINEHEVELSGKVNRYKWMSACDSIWFERLDIWDLRALITDEDFGKPIRSFPAFYDNDRIGDGHLIDFVEAERLVRHVERPFLYILRPKNNDQLIGVKVSAAKQNKLVYIKNSENIEVVL